MCKKGGKLGKKSSTELTDKIPTSMKMTKLWSAAAAIAFVLATAAAANIDEDDRIKVELYYESQCPGCRQVRLCRAEPRYRRIIYLT